MEPLELESPLRREPGPRLRALVRRYEGYVERAPAGARQRRLPHGLVPLIVGFGAPMRMLDAQQPAAAGERHRAFVAGLHDSCTITELEGVSRGVQVDLTPIGAHLVLGMPMDRVTNRVFELEDVFGAAGRDLPERLHAAADWDERFAAVEALIVARLAKAKPASPAVAWAWRRLDATAGRASVGALAEQIGWSRKHLASRFREQIGMPPKLVARILRFDDVRRRIDRGDERGWAAAAYASGYYDQAHLVRDFRAFADMTRGDYVRHSRASASSS